MTVDVEDYFHVSAFEPYISRASWDKWPRRVECNTEYVLDLFARHEVQATFFVLGWVARRHPALVRRIVAGGHEVASHGFGHVRVTEQSPAEFRADVLYSKQLLEDITGTPVLGYRAPSYSIGTNNLWALDILQDLDFQYDSSIYPVHHDFYGMPEARRFPFWHKTGGLMELPISTVVLGRRNVPCGGGGYFRLFTYRFSRWAIQHINRREGQPCLFYFHPWELDPGQPRPEGLGLKTRFRHYLNLGRMEHRLDCLLSDFSWGRVDKVFPIVKEQAA